jgi:hypothetical protein
VETIDVTFDFRTDATGPDVDSSSLTLKKYHQSLWSKPLPNGEIFKLNSDQTDCYLQYQSKNRSFSLSSDSISNSYRDRKRKDISEIVMKIPSEVRSFQDLGNTIGGFIIFPYKVDGLSINQARGVNHRIADRFDLTLECIRLHYQGEANPLAEVLNRNEEFFRLFETFSGYVKFFLLDDLVSQSYDSINFFLPNFDFEKSGYPTDTSEYLQYRQSSMSFTRHRNHRIQVWASSQ